MIPAKSSIPARAPAAPLAQGALAAKPATEPLKEKIKRLRVEVEQGNQTSLLFLLDELIKKAGL